MNQKPVIYSLNGKASLMKTSNLGGTAVTVQQHIHMHLATLCLFYTVIFITIFY
jgi:hypothetical protein